MNLVSIPSAKVTISGVIAQGRGKEGYSFLLPGHSGEYKRMDVLIKTIQLIHSYHLYALQQNKTTTTPFVEGCTYHTPFQIRQMSSDNTSLVSSLLQIKLAFNYVNMLCDIILKVHKINNSIPSGGCTARPPAI